MTAATHAAVVVTYFPDAGFEVRLADIVREVGAVLVVDNSEDVGVQERLGALCRARGAEFFANGSNLGLAAALNQAFTRFASIGCSVAFAFDPRPNEGSFWRSPPRRIPPF